MSFTTNMTSQRLKFIQHDFLCMKKCIFQVCSSSLDALLNILSGDVITRKNDITVTSFHVLSGGTNCFGPGSHYQISCFLQKLHHTILLHSNLLEGVGFLAFTTVISESIITTVVQINLSLADNVLRKIFWHIEVSLY